MAPSITLAPEAPFRSCAAGNALASHLHLFWLHSLALSPVSGPVKWKSRTQSWEKTTVPLGASLAGRLDAGNTPQGEWGLSGATPGFLRNLSGSPLPWHMGLSSIGLSG